MTEKMTTGEKKELIKKMSRLTGLSEDSISLLARWNEYDALSHKNGLIDEFVMRTPDYVFDRYKKLLEARKEDTGEESEIASAMAVNIQYFLENYKEVTLTECHNYATARGIMPCSRERLKRIKEELKKEREGK